MIRRFAWMPLGIGLLVAFVNAANAADEKGKPPAVPRAQAAKVPAPRPAAPRVPAPGPGVARPPAAGAPHPNQQLDRLLKMSPEQREKWLSTLPEPQRQNIERGLNEIQKFPPALQNRARAGLEMLRGLPQPRQNQVRRSINQYGQLPPERRGLLNQEMQKISGLPEEDRRAYMNTEEFRNRYSGNEQQIMSNLSLITPELDPRE